MNHVLTIDIEDWFHCLAPDPRDWDKFERRVEKPVGRLLGLLADNNAKATFFVLGDVASRCPTLIRQLAIEGHEVASHGMNHQHLKHLTPEQFRQDLKLSINLLEDITSSRISSYRAPYFSITKKTGWALDILVEEGIRCDSSIFPVHNHRYGIPDSPRTPYLVKSNLWEYSVSTLPTPVGNLPFAGGVYFRFLPLSLTFQAFRLLEKRQEPSVFYIHPWELDPEQPNYKTDSPFLNFRHYYGLDKSSRKLAALLERFPFISLENAIREHEG